MVSTPFSSGAHVVAYLRDSGHEDQEASVDQQEAQIREFCLANGLILTTIYADAAAPGSSTIGRDRFLEMIHHFRSPDCKDSGVIVWKFNRFARDIDDAQF
jgi:site-specific DNA recombinase